MKKVSTILAAFAIAALSYTTASAQVLINEVDADQTGTDTAEFVELYNAGGAPVDLTAGSYVLAQVNGSDDLSYDAVDLTGTIASGDFYVIGVTGVPNLDLDALVGGFWNATNAIQNGQDGLVLLTGTTAAAYPNDTDMLTGAGTAIDGMTYHVGFSSADPALAAACFVTGQALVNEGGGVSKDTDSSQRIGDGAGGAFINTSFIAAPPTPGAGNAVPVELSTFSIN